MSKPWERLRILVDQDSRLHHSAPALQLTLQHQYAYERSASKKATDCQPITEGGVTYNALKPGERHAQVYSRRNG